MQKGGQGGFHKPSFTWQYKLAPETINLPARAGIEEIEIFDIALKIDALDEDILCAIDRAIPLPIVFRLHRGKQFNRKVALNAELRDLKTEIDRLSA